MSGTKVFFDIVIGNKAGNKILVFLIISNRKIEN